MRFVIGAGEGGGRSNADIDEAMSFALFILQTALWSQYNTFSWSYCQAVSGPKT